MTESPTPIANGSGGASGIRPIAIEEEMKRSYLDYAMSVIVSRALPDVRDGLKPVQRRILYAMLESGYLWNRPYRKAARIVGEVMGKYHPHGDQSIYDALARLTQDFSLRLPLLDGQGNFGSMDGDPPAAMRYTETRLTRIAEEALLADIDRDTVDFQTNYDSSESEPAVLPALLPNLLINGAGGIAVGMATNIPPHNPSEILEACLALLEDPEISAAQLRKIVPGPDFPTGGIIMGDEGIREAYATGRGGILVRAKLEVQTPKRGGDVIVLRELPYQVNKAAMIEKIAELVRSRRVEGIAALRDESDRDGVRVVIELRRDAETGIILNQLYKHTPMQSSFGVNMVALSGGRPEIFDLKTLIQEFLSFREEIIRRRTLFLLGEARRRAHLLAGLSIAVVHIDKIVALIRAAEDAKAARDALMKPEWEARQVKPLLELIADPRHSVSAEGRYRLSEAQARGILDLRLQRLTALGREEIEKELAKLKKDIESSLAILQKRENLLRVIREELQALRERLTSPRRTQIAARAEQIDDEDLIQSEDMVVMVTHSGYIKRVPLSRYRTQERGGKGRAAIKMRDEDFVTTLFTASTHDLVLFFSSAGKVYQMKIWNLPLGQPHTKGKALVNLLSLGKHEITSSIMPMPSDETQWEKKQLMFATKGGHVRRNKLGDFVRVTRAGKIAMKLTAGDKIIGVAICEEGRDDILLTSRKGMCVRFPVGDVRLFAGRGSLGVRGMSLARDDAVISMSVLRHAIVSPEERDAYKRREDSEGEPPALALTEERRTEMAESEQFILGVSSRGFGKRTSSHDYRVTKRGGKGIVAMIANERNGDIAAAFPVHRKDQIMLVTSRGQTIRLNVEGKERPIPITSRATQGVNLFKLKDEDQGDVVSVAHIREMEEEA